MNDRRLDASNVEYGTFPYVNDGKKPIDRNCLKSNDKDCEAESRNA